MTVIRLNNVSKQFPIQKGFFKKTVGYVHALSNISLSIDSAQVVGVVGESGSGKSTLARVIMQLLPLSSGSVEFQGTPLSFLSRRALRPFRRRMQIVFQHPSQSLNSRKTISDILRAPIEFHRVVAAEKTCEYVDELLDQVGLKKAFASRYPHELSIGQQQRVAIARAISVRPDFIIFDECVSALDLSVQAQILNLLQDIQSRWNLSFLFISHDLNVVRHIADRIVVMHNGRIVEHEETEKLFQHPQHAITKQLIESILPSYPQTITR